MTKKYTRAEALRIARTPRPVPSTPDYADLVDAIEGVDDPRIAAMSDEQLIHELLVALLLDHTGRPYHRALTAAIVRRGLVDEAERLAAEWTRDERRRRGE